MRDLKIKADVDNTGIRKQVFLKIIDLAKLYQLSKVVLFGSRARGDHYDKSDIDLAVAGGNITEFSLDVEDETETLLQYDIVDLEKAEEKLIENIRKDGIIIYEKI